MVDNYQAVGVSSSRQLSSRGVFIKAKVWLVKTNEVAFRAPAQEMRKPPPAKLDFKKILNMQVCLFLMFFRRSRV